MKIQESLGIVTDNGKLWETLCECIVEYMYDMMDGLNANPFNLDIDTIYMSNIISFYKYKHGIIKNDIIPNWIGDFEICLSKDINSKGRFEKPLAELKDGKLYFTIKVKDYAEKTMDQFHETLTHEFRHAYTTWIEKTKNISIHKKNDAYLYREATKGFTDERFNKGIQLIKEYGPDYLNIDQSIYNDINKLELIILTSFYYIDIDEVNSFLQEFAASMKFYINKQVNNKKTDFNKLVNSDKSISCYNNQYYRIYMAYLEFWKGVNNIPDEIVNQLIGEKLRKIIKVYLNIDLYRHLVTNNRTPKNILQLVAKRQIRIYEKVIKKMNKIHAKLIMNVMDTHKLNIEINKEIHDEKFEQDLLDMIK